MYFLQAAQNFRNFEIKNKFQEFKKKHILGISVIFGISEILGNFRNV
jgi:hypothetical protein